MFSYSFSINYYHTTTRESSLETENMALREKINELEVRIKNMQENVQSETFKKNVKDLHNQVSWHTD